MAMLRATILGCGASPGVPRIGNDWGACDPGEPKNRRSRCSLLLERFDGNDQPTRVLVDTSPDMRAQLLEADVAHIDGVVYTHGHADHLHGIDDLRAFWLMTKKLVNVYADSVTEARVLGGFGYCFATPTGSAYPPILKSNRITVGKAFSIDGAGGRMTIIPFRQVHGDVDSLGLRIDGLAYSCDVSAVPEGSLEALADLDVWIVDALRYQPHPSHFSLSEALEWIKRLNPRQAVLTHMASDLDYATLKRELPAGVKPAFDGMRLEVVGG